MVDWDSKKRQKFQEALQQVYLDYDDLEIFVDYALGENLADIAPKQEMYKVVYKLLKRFENALDGVFEAFKEVHPNHPAILLLERQDFVSLKLRASHLAQSDWDQLFSQFLPDDDLADLQRAFKKGFKDAKGITLEAANPRQGAFADVMELRALLEQYDIKTKESNKPVLAVRFAERAIKELRRSDEDETRDLSGLEAWRDRIAQQFDVRLLPKPPEQTPGRYAYLLITLEEHGADVNVYPELRATNSKDQIRFGAKPVTCSVDEVSKHISSWIREAEAAIETDTDTYDDEEVTLEVFLPWRHLERDLAHTWEVQDKWNDTVLFGDHRRFLVRSFDRIRDRNCQRALERRWQALAACVQANTACSQFRRQAQCLTRKGSLRSLLHGDIPGLKFVAPLPTDSELRTGLLKDIIDAAVPIALWSCEDVPDVSAFEAELDALLEGSQLTNFTDLAERWRTRRVDPATAAATKPIRLLCDRPDRLPNLPDPKKDSDVLIAS